jgi:hypothetical protein
VSEHAGNGFISIEVPTSWPQAHTLLKNIPETLPNPKKATTWKMVDLPNEMVYYLLT